MTELILAMIAMIGVIYLSYLFSKYLATGTSKMNSAKYMKIIDRLPTGQDRSVIILQIGDKHYLVGNTSQSINILTELSKDQLVELPSEGHMAIHTDSFKNALEGMLNKKTKEK
ncbi:MAG: flagellar biosynthetic protein FliO [Anaerovorax sp.]|nr:flagellar biosynthetic protein FliO [Anaerovorax sp.]